MHNPIIWKSVPALETNRRADAIVLEKVIGQADEMFLQSPIGEEFETIVSEVELVAFSMLTKVAI